MSTILGRGSSWGLGLHAVEDTAAASKLEDAHTGGWKLTAGDHENQPGERVEFGAGGRRRRRSRSRRRSIRGRGERGGSGRLGLGEGHGAHGDAVLPLSRLASLALALPLRVLVCERRRAEHLGPLLNGSAAAAANEAGAEVRLRGGDVAGVHLRLLLHRRRRLGFGLVGSEGGLDSGAGGVVD
jgi:hypothetical protein